MIKGLMDRCVSHETVISHLREKVEARESELRELTAWNREVVHKKEAVRKGGPSTQETQGGNGVNCW